MKMIAANFLNALITLKTYFDKVTELWVLKNLVPFGSFLKKEKEGLPEFYDEWRLKVIDFVSIVRVH